jgi:hypothetical protein
MGRAILPSPWNRVNKYAFELFDDFNYFVNADLWTVLVSDGTTTAAHEGDGSRSRFKLYTDTTDNNECDIATTNELFKFLTLKPIYVAGLIQYAEGNTDDANVAFGLADALGADLIADDGGAVGIANEGALIYKKDGATVWSFCTEMDTVNTASTSTTTAGGSSAQLLAIDILWLSATVFQARPFVDGVQLIDSTSGDPICHNVTLGTATDMDFGVYLKTGRTGAETLYVDWLYACQAR